MMILEVRIFQPISPFHDAHLPSLIIQSLPGTGKIVMSHAGPLYHLYHPSSFIHPIDPIDPFLVAQRQVNPLYTPLVIQHKYGKSKIVHS